MRGWAEGVLVRQWSRLSAEKKSRHWHARSTKEQKEQKAAFVMISAHNAGLTLGGGAVKEVAASLRALAHESQAGR